MKTSHATLVTAVLAAFIGLQPIAGKAQVRNEEGRGERGHHEGRRQEGCRFLQGSSCWGVLTGTLWAETINFETPNGPTKIKKGQTITKIDQSTNAYNGFKLRNVSFKLARDSHWRSPSLKIYVNSRKQKQPVESDGGFWRGYEPEIYNFDVNDCPLDFWAVIGNADVKAYSVTYYWEYPTGTDSGGGYYPIPGGFPGPYGCVAPPPMQGPGGADGAFQMRMTAEYLTRSLRAIQGSLDGMTYGQVVEPILLAANNFLTELLASNPVVAAPQARALFDVFQKHEAELEKLSTVPNSARCVEAIRVAVRRLERDYKP